MLPAFLSMFSHHYHRRDDSDLHGLSSTTEAKRKRVCMSLQDVDKPYCFFVSHSTKGEFATGHFFGLLLPVENTIEQSPPHAACFHSCHTAIFSFKKQKVILSEKQFTFQVSSFACIKMDSSKIEKLRSQTISPRRPHYWSTFLNHATTNYYGFGSHVSAPAKMPVSKESYRDSCTGSTPQHREHLSSPACLDAAYTSLTMSLFSHHFHKTNDSDLHRLSNKKFTGRESYAKARDCSVERPLRSLYAMLPS